ncbi:MAG: hypothetical protein ACI4JA_04680 [Oscillospiraceae bacterium]
MINFKRIFTGIITCAVALTAAVFPASAENEEFTAYLCYAGGDGSCDVWDSSDKAPEVKISGNGEYTVEYTADKELSSDVTFLGVQTVGLEKNNKVNLKTVKVTADDKEVDISGLSNLYVTGIWQLKVVEDPCEIAEFEGAKSIKVTFAVEGAGGEEAEAASDEAAPSDMLTTDSSAPTLGFDSDDWGDYIGIIDDTDSGAYSIKKETDIVYQGASIKLTAAIDKTPDYSTDNETTMGVVLEAEKFGLENFDGYTLNFYARFNTNVEGKLFENSVYAYGVNADGEMTSSAIKKINFDTTSNVNGYEKQFVTLPTNSNTTKIVIKVPLSKAYEGDVMYFDNITLISSQKDSSDNAYQIKTLDTYNSKAKVTNTGDVIKQNEKENTLDESIGEPGDSDKGGFNPLIIVIIALVAAVVVIIVIFIIKHKNRYY